MFGSPERGAIIAEGNEEHLRVRGGPGIYSSLLTAGRYLTTLVTDMPTLVCTLRILILTQILISLIVRPGFPDQKVSGFKELEECIGNTSLESGV